METQRDENGVQKKAVLRTELLQLLEKKINTPRAKIQRRSEVQIPSGDLERATRTARIETAGKGFVAETTTVCRGRIEGQTRKDDKNCRE
jgi:hypothetical protein